METEGTLTPYHCIFFTLRLKVTADSGHVIIWMTYFEY